MKEELSYIGKKIVENKYSIADKLVYYQNEKYKKILEHSDQSYEQLIEWRAELIGTLGYALYGDSEVVKKAIDLWALKIGDFSIQNEIDLSDTLRALTCYRSVIWEIFSEELTKRAFSPITMLDVGKRIDPLLDEISSIFGLMWEEHKNELMDRAYTALDELAVPVVPIEEDIAIIPIVGGIDSRRAALIMETSLEKSRQFDVKYIILDISGVPDIDEMVADQIIKITKALSLTGVQVYLTGIRAEIAQTIVELKIPFFELKTCGSLRQALSIIKRIES